MPFTIRFKGIFLVLPLTNSSSTNISSTNRIHLIQFWSSPHNNYFCPSYLVWLFHHDRSLCPSLGVIHSQTNLRSAHHHSWFVYRSHVLLCSEMYLLSGQMSLHSHLFYQDHTCIPWGLLGHCICIFHSCQCGTGDQRLSSLLQPIHLYLVAQVASTSPAMPCVLSWVAAWIYSWFKLDMDGRELRLWIGVLKPCRWCCDFQLV